MGDQQVLSPAQAAVVAWLDEASAILDERLERLATADDLVGGPVVAAFYPHRMGSGEAVRRLDAVSAGFYARLGQVLSGLAGLAAELGPADAPLRRPLLDAAVEHAALSVVYGALAVIGDGDGW